MRDAPRPVSRSSIERRKVDWLVHGGISEAPDERSDRQIARDEYDGIGKGGNDQAVQQHEVRYGAHPARGRPDKNGYQHCASAQGYARAGRARRAQPRPLGGGQVAAEYPLH